MYITFFQEKQKKYENISFKELWENPYRALPEGYGVTEIIKATHEISDETAKRYFIKHHYLCFRTPELPCTLEEIPTMYRHFQIPKKTNPRKKRNIDTPQGTPLAAYLTTWKTIIDNQLHFLAHNAAHGYVAERSTITERQVHIRHKSKWFLYLDLKDFFPSHNKEYCMRMLKEVYPFGVMLKDDAYKNHIENMVDYALLNNVLPQGTPLSPTLTNILMVPIDDMITKKLKDFDKKNFVYTRYADDITISCKQKFSVRKVIKVIEEILASFDTPFKLNTNKIKYGSIAGKNYHLGTIINKDNQLKLGHKKNQKLRAALFQYGLNHIYNDAPIDLHATQVLLGNIAYAKAIDPKYIKHILRKYSNKFGVDIEKHMIQKINGPSS